MKTSTPDERGSALLLTLGILSLALIVAMAFAFSARLNRQIAKVNADQTKARLLAESTLNLVVAALMNEDDIYLPESSGLFANAGDLPACFISDGEIIPEYDLAKDTHILPVLGQFGTLPTPRFSTIEVDGETIGRVAFLVLEEGDKLDVNQMLSLSGKIPFVQAGQNHLASFTATPEAADYVYAITAEEAVTEGNTLRLGLQMQELRIAAYYLTQLPSGYTGTRTRWFSYTHLWNVLWKVPLTDEQDPLRYTFFSGEDIEAYWDQDAEAAMAGTGERQRFDITGHEWGGWQHPSENGTVAAANYARGLAAALLNHSQPFWDTTKPNEPAAVKRITETTVPPDFSGIPWLSTLTPATARPQVAANMVDFCDSDNYATTDATWTGTPPTYCGNEKVPYINEISLEFSLIEDGGKYKLQLKPTLEMVNIFTDNFPAGKIRIRISGKVKFESEVAKKDWSYEISEYSTDEQSKCSYVKYDLAEFQVAESETSSPAEVTDELLVIIGPAGQIYDVAYWKIPTGNNVILNVGESKTISLEVSDPRCNHRSDCWKISGPSLGSRNSIFPETKPENADSEDYENGLKASGGEGKFASTFSTAFIPNRPFRSLWELGAIHRGEPFRTLDIAGEDAEILDQVKLGPLKYSRGKFNANSRNPLSWAELLCGINISAGYEDTDYYGDEEDEAAPPPEPDFTSISPSHSRVATAAVLASFGAIDREREALIGRTANLLTTRMDKYSALVIGQALQKIDLPEGFAMTPEFQRTLINPVQIGTEWYSLLATQRILAHIVRDAWRNEYKIVQLQIIED